MGRIAPAGRGIGVVVAVSGAFLAAPAAAGRAPESRLELRLAWVNLSPLRGSTVHAALAHAGRLLERGGIAMDSRWEPDASLQPPDVLRIVLLPGRGHGDESATAAGVTRRGPQGQGIWLYPRAIAESLGLQLSAQHLWRAGDERAYRRTLGFVLTHELLHCLAGAKHSPTGIMVPHLSLGGLAPSSGIPLDLFPPLRRGVQRLALGLATVPHDDEQAAAPSAGDDAVFGP